MNRFRPAIGWIVVRLEQLAETTAGGIVKPPSVIDREQAGDGECAPTFEVIAIPDNPQANNFAVLTGVKNFDLECHYPPVGAQVLVIAKAGGSVVKYDKSTWFVRLDALAGMVTAENA